MFPNRNERISKATRIALIFCMKCPREIRNDPKKDEHGCEHCWVYWIMNSISEGKDIEESEGKEK